MPVASTTPETSQPRTNGGRPRKPPVARCFQSVGLTPAARTRTSTSFGRGEGRSTSTTSRTSGPPRVCWLMTCMVLTVLMVTSLPVASRQGNGRIANLRYDRAMQQVERVVVLALDGVYPFELGIPSRIFGAADGRYEVLTCSVDGQPVRSNADFGIIVEHGPEALATADTVVIAPVSPAKVTADLPEEVSAALALIRPGARIVSICTGAFVLAAAGLLDGHRATTHWQVADLFR